MAYKIAGLERPGNWKQCTRIGGTNLFTFLLQKTFFFSRGARMKQSCVLLRDFSVTLSTGLKTRAVGREERHTQEHVCF